jgi:amino acid transporter
MTSEQSAPAGRVSAQARVVVATTAMLSFISFWRGAAIVLNDMGSSAFYAGAIAEQAIGTAAPWFILAIMLLAYAVRSLYIESCSMFVRGGVYRVVKEAMGSTLAKFSVSALMFDYILTGPISGVSAGLYLVGLLNELLPYVHPGLQLPVNATAAVFAILVTLYFWWENVKGIPESSEKALRIMYVTTVMVVLLIGWSAYTMWVRGAHLPPLPYVSNLTYSPDALGWLRGSRLPYTIGLLGILIGLGHSVLAMSGEETLAQVYREIEHPKLKNLEKAGLLIFVYSILFTAGVSFMAAMIIPDEIRRTYFDNPIGGLAMHLVGPLPLRLLFRGFVAVVGTMMLAGAVNTAIVGSNGVLNRVSEDGILPAWFRQPHPRFGTSYRILNTVVLLQIITIIISRGDIFVLGEAYAFGVMWSFAMKGLAVLVLRFKQPGQREFRVPLNFKVGRWEIPLGLGLITLTLTALCVINLFTKQVATVSGVAFTLIFFGIFSLSERLTHRSSEAGHTEMDQFNLHYGEELTPKEVGCKPGNILVPVSNFRTLQHLAGVLDRVKVGRRGVVVLYVRLLKRMSASEYELDQDQLFSSNEQYLFTQVLALAEKRGKPVHLAVVASNDLWEGILRTAQSLQSSTIVLGKSAKWTTDEQARQMGLAWERLADPRPQFHVEIFEIGGQRGFYMLGPHTPNLTANEIALIHRLWLHFSERLAPAEIHHHDIVHFALNEVEHELAEGKEHDVLERLQQHIAHNQDAKAPRG